MGGTALDKFKAYKETNDEKIVDIFENKVVRFPYDRVPLTYYIDGERGDDKNDGKSWAKAKRTLTAPWEEIGPDLKGYGCDVFVAPGTYPDALVFRYSNGPVAYHWCGGFANGLTHGYHYAITNNGERTDFSYDPIIITNQNTGSYPCNIRDPQKGKWPFFFFAQDFKYGWNQSGYAYWNRWQFKATRVIDTCVYFEGMGLGCNANLHIDLENITGYGIQYWDTSGFNRGLSIDGYSREGKYCPAGTSTSIWNGAIFTKDANMNFSLIQIGYHPDYNKPSTMFGVTGVKNLVCQHTPESFNKLAEWVFGYNGEINYDFGTFTGSATANPKINLGGNFGGTIYYNPDYVELVDTTPKPHIVINKKTNSTINYLGNKSVRFNGATSGFNEFSSASLTSLSAVVDALTTIGIFKA